MRSQAASTANSTSVSPTREAKLGRNRATPLMPNVYAAAVATTPSSTTGTSHGTVRPASTVSWLLNAIGRMPERPRAAIATVATTRPPAARVSACRPEPSAVTSSDIMK